MGQLLLQVIGFVTFDEMVIVRFLVLGLKLDISSLDVHKVLHTKNQVNYGEHNNDPFYCKEQAPVHILDLVT